MPRSKVRIALVTTLAFSFACSDDGGGVAEAGRGTSTETAGAESQEDAGSDDEIGDEESGGANSGDGDGDSGDGDGDSGDGDGDSGDGDDDSGDGDGDSGDGDSGDGDSGDGDGDSGDGDSGDGDSGDGDSGDGDSGDGDSGDDGGVGSEGGLIWCGDKLYECGDGLDNDMDGLVDLDDHECTTPCDDNEETFKTDLPGQNEDCKQDCYFDENSGHGDDQCLWHLTCDPENPGGEIGCAPNGSMCEPEVPTECKAFCEPLVPNGCDCFGCCIINGMNVYLDGAECTLATLADCSSCTFVEECSNPCDGDCEVCAGQTPADLPPECNEPSCPEGVTPCFDVSDCSEDQFCLTGCCTDILPQ